MKKMLVVLMLTAMQLQATQREEVYPVVDDGRAPALAFVGQRVPFKAVLYINQVIEFEPEVLMIPYERTLQFEHDDIDLLCDITDRCVGRIRGQLGQEYKDAFKLRESCLERGVEGKQLLQTFRTVAVAEKNLDVFRYNVTYLLLKAEEKAAKINVKDIGALVDYLKSKLKKVEELKRDIGDYQQQIEALGDSINNDTMQNSLIQDIASKQSEFSFALVVNPSRSEPLMGTFQLVHEDGLRQTFDYEVLSDLALQCVALTLSNFAKGKNFAARTAKFKLQLASGFRLSEALQGIEMGIRSGENEQEKILKKYIASKKSSWRVRQQPVSSAGAVGTSGAILLSSLAEDEPKNNGPQGLVGVLAPSKPLSLTEDAIALQQKEINPVSIELTLKGAQPLERFLKEQTLMEEQD